VNEGKKHPIHQEGSCKRSAAALHWARFTHCHLPSPHGQFPLVPSSPLAVSWPVGNTPLDWEGGVTRAPRESTQGFHDFSLLPCCKRHPCPERVERPLLVETSWGSLIRVSPSCHMKENPRKAKLLAALENRKIFGK
jgi:hypothetical protein